ncbi:hypothetical protein MTR62_10690 [Novosphingobium sp. 1949]|uniref:Short chain dehydrogenase-like proteobacteria domain-containing protein n=1 Tax=Novosphingobium organovorum TaxID=2930092 RepID=A0ABT0BDN7_9SPHN|nr:hypothetical protein [Novosphingobium organovorum]MCJ2183155.1 hypothetical protein [Novosphingobium organovorum]
MGELLYVGPLSDDPLDAAADFHARLLPAIEATLGGGADPLTLVFEPALIEQRAWRRAVVQGLARRYAPSRVNALEADSRAALEATRGWIEATGAITGQLFALDSHGATTMV